MRINKYIASSGLCSRRQADEMIKNGEVRVNGQILKELGFDISENDVIQVKNKNIEPTSSRVVLMLNKPVGYITSAKDEQGRPTVMELVADFGTRLFPVGRLDFNTSGLLLFTNDGDLAQSISHPKNNTSKTYIARVTGGMDEVKLSKLKKGVKIDCNSDPNKGRRFDRKNSLNEPPIQEKTSFLMEKKKKKNSMLSKGNVDSTAYLTSPAEGRIIKEDKASDVVELTIHEGRNRQVRKMFAAVGCKVQELQRVAVGNLQLGHLKVGQYRKLSPSEIEALLKK
ncbi:MAG: pseudouridine synthase [Anaerovoracaceae bacterium]